MGLSDCQVSLLNIPMNKMAASRGGMFIQSKLGQNRSEMDVRTSARIKKVIWDQLLATKAVYLLSCIFVLRVKHCTR